MHIAVKICLDLLGFFLSVVNIHRVAVALLLNRQVKRDFITLNAHTQKRFVYSFIMRV